MTALTPAQRNSAYRQRKAAKIARYEAALREIVGGRFPDGEGMTCDDCADVARQALGDA